MLSALDRRLNAITMYRLTAFVLLGALLAAITLSALRVLSFDPFAMAFGAGFLVAVCWAINTLLARLFRVPANPESTHITALILALIYPPLGGYADLPALAAIAAVAMASKYLIAPFRKHLFNPVALAAAFGAVVLGREATWWLANAPMLPFVAVGGLLIARKVRRDALIATFLGVALGASLLLSLIEGDAPLAAVRDVIVLSPLIFFATVILTEPITLPGTRAGQIAVAALTGLLFTPQFHIGESGFTPEAAMLVGNALAWLIGPRRRYTFAFTRRVHLGADVWDYFFTASPALTFVPGQYLEWTLGHADADVRGLRRLLTVASSPRERETRVGLKIPEAPSTWKRALMALQPGQTLTTAQVCGDFTLPREPGRKLAFIAGGIGITPFRSMVQDLLDRGEKRDIVLFYSNRYADEIAYRDVFDAARRVGVRTVYALTGREAVPIGWGGHVGRVDADLLRRQLPDFAERTFYLSGPNSLVDAFQAALREMGVPGSQVHKDYFPGF
ncbi:MAG: hypothetical protein K1X39_08815 [Thermoflexales bacterium]|nr:hypothetical protein [Thermoflexales bacterium]